MGTKVRSAGLTLAAIIFFFSLCAAVPPAARAQSDPPPASDWELRLIPYVWAFSLDTKATVGGVNRSLTGSVDLSFGDIIDFLDLGAMGSFELWHGRWGLIFDGLYMDLGADGSFSGRREGVQFDLDTDVRIGMADLALACRLFDKPLGQHSAQRLTLEPYAGMRYGYLKQKVDLDIDIGEVGKAGRTLGSSEDWVEPLIGGRIIWTLNKRWALHVKGDVGGFGIGSASNLTWQIAGGVDFTVTKSIAINAGYRYLDFDYSRGSGAEKLGMDLQAKGPYVGLTILL